MSRHAEVQRSNAHAARRSSSTFRRKLGPALAAATGLSRTCLGPSVASRTTVGRSPARIPWMQGLSHWRRLANLGPEASPFLKIRVPAVQLRRRPPNPRPDTPGPRIVRPRDHPTWSRGRSASLALNALTTLVGHDKAPASTWRDPQGSSKGRDGSSRRSTLGVSLRKVCDTTSAN